MCDCAEETKGGKGLLMVFTGNGKGKTTAAIGLAMRAVGHGFRVCFIQFIKGSWRSGEQETMGRFRGRIDFHVMGRGFTWKSDDLEKDRRAARAAWDKAREAIFSGKYQMVILDEFTYLLSYKMVDRDEALGVFSKKPQGLHVVITGRDALPELVDMADLVTEMREVRHPYKNGIRAQKGIEY